MQASTPHPSDAPLAHDGNPYTLLLADDVSASAAILTRFLGTRPVELSETFALFLMGGGKLGLWKRGDVEPSVTSRPGSSEFALALTGGRQAVEAAMKHAEDSGLAILQTPTDLDFGYTFVGALPDGHRIRIFSPA